MTNPRKFSEKIALHNQKQAEETAAFERIMQEVSVTRVINNPPPPNTNHLQPHPQGFLRPYLGGSLPNVNQIAANPHMTFHPPSGYDDSKPMGKHSGRFDFRMRPYGFNHRRPLPLELSRNRMVPLDGHPSQHPNSYLSPPPESSWRRTHSDSALHKSVMNPTAQDPFNSNLPSHNQSRHESFESSHNTAPNIYKAMMENKRFGPQFQTGNRTKSSDAPTMSRITSTDASSLRAATNMSMPYNNNGNISNMSSAMAIGLPHVSQIGNNTGSLPDLTNLHIPTPLINPIDGDDLPTMSQQQGGTMQPPPLYNQSRNPSNVMSSHLSGMPRQPTSPSRSRRNPHNGPSPLTLSSTERVKVANQGSTKMTVPKPEIKSPPITGPYPHAQAGVPRGGWPLPSPDHPGSPPYGQIMSPPANKQSEFTTGNNPTLSEAYYNSDLSSLQPLQHQFEQFHVVSDANNSQRYSVAPPVYSALTTLNEDGLYSQASLAYAAHEKQGRTQSNSKIPDIVFTGVEDSNKSGSVLFGGNVYNSFDFDEFSAMKPNQYMEELQMLDEPNIINDPAIDDQLRLDSM